MRRRYNKSQRDQLSFLVATMTDGNASLPLAVLDPAQKMQIRELLRLHLPPPPHLPSTISALADEMARCDMEIARLQERLDELLVKRADVQAHSLHLPSTVSALADELTPCEVEIARLHERLDELLVKRADVQARCTDCNSLLAPIRRLPSEILVEIFEICWCSYTSTIDEVEHGAPSPATKISILAHAPLLDLSQVCVRWHRIVLGTPALWRGINLDADLWTAPMHVNRNMQLLRVALERSGNHSLSVTVLNHRGEEPPHLPAFDLIARHSERWQMVVFGCPFSDLLHFSGLKGKLSHLEFLVLYCWGEGAEAMEVFQDLPRLRFLQFGSNRSNFASFALLPWEQLTRVRCTELDPGMRDGLSPLITAGMPRLSRGSSLAFQLSLAEVDATTSFQSGGPLVTSDITLLDIEVSQFSLTAARKALDVFFATLILPFLNEIGFMVRERNPHLSLPWPESQFLSLSERSSFHSHLNTLHIYDVAISEAELIRALAALPSLQRLSISDHPQLPLDDSMERVLITNTLLMALTRTPDSPSLVPNLSFFDCQSMLLFDDNVYLDCLLSRIQGLLGSDVFECELWWLPGHHREQDPTVSGRIRELCFAKELLFLFAEAEEN